MTARRLNYAWHHFKWFWMKVHNFVKQRIGNT